ncbi:transposase, partial [Mycobacterium ulcerans]
DYPSERLIACRNPLLATQRARKRAELLTVTEAALAPIIAAVACGRLAGAGRIGVKVGKVLAKFKMAKHFHLDITDTTLTVTRDQTKIDAEAALDGIYVLRTSVTANELDPAAVVVSYKNLANVERDFRSIKTDDLDLRPIHHRLDDRVKAHILIAMLACYLVWHLRKAWAPMTYTDENLPARENPVTPAEGTTSPGSTPRKRDTTLFANSKPWATTSPSTERPDRSPSKRTSRQSSRQVNKFTDASSAKRNVSTPAVGAQSGNL